MGLLRRRFSSVDEMELVGSWVGVVRPTTIFCVLAAAAGIGMSWGGAHLAPSGTSRYQQAAAHQPGTGSRFASVLTGFVVCFGAFPR